MPKGDLVTCDTQATASSDHSAESIQQGGLATAVWPNQAYDLVLGNLERHIVDGDHATEADGQITRTQLRGFRSHDSTDLLMIRTR
ncbi:hypothetical protein GFS60_01996 [Rhodococcus sp. WAY2]|nr:hypothetical protein GFS60_01996 [Rhodococcus sp. WAY2]